MEECVLGYRIWRGIALDAVGSCGECFDEDEAVKRWLRGDVETLDGA